VPGLAALPGSIWLLPRDAMVLVRLNREAGGFSEIAKTEFRRCKLCGRPAIGSEAEELRYRAESAPDARTLPCGPNCSRDREMKIYMRERK
jgi:hypothetical protein